MYAFDFLFLFGIKRLTLVYVVKVQLLCNILVLFGKCRGLMFRKCIFFHFFKVFTIDRNKNKLQPELVQEADLFLRRINAYLSYGFEP